MVLSAPQDGERERRGGESAMMVGMAAPTSARPRWSARRVDRERVWLERMHARYLDPALIDPDPLVFVRQVENPADQELVGLIAACLAYGNVKAMLPAIEQVLARLAPHPHAALRQATRRQLAAAYRGFRYRFTDGRQLAGLLWAARTAIVRHGSIEQCFAQHYDSADETVLPALGGLVDELMDAAPVSLAHLVPHPAGRSACKRMNLFLRWMIRRDVIDPGPWRVGSASQLVMPLDTHVFHTARERGWTQRRTPNLAAALEVTNVLRAVCPADPLRYDFAVTRPGIRGAVRAPKCLH